MFWNLPLSPLTALVYLYAVSMKENAFYRLIREIAKTDSNRKPIDCNEKSRECVCLWLLQKPFEKSESFDPTGRKITIQIHKLFMCNEAGNWWLCKFYSKGFWPQKTPPKELAFIFVKYTNLFTGKDEHFLSFSFSVLWVLGKRDLGWNNPGKEIETANCFNWSHVKYQDPEAVCRTRHTLLGKIKPSVYTCSLEEDTAMKSSSSHRYRLLNKATQL